MSRLISAIVTVYNRAALIAGAVASLALIGPDQLEILVVDDGSTDETAAVIEGLNDPRVRLIRHGQNQGIPAARNTGLQAAHGEYIAWLDSDDLSRPHRLRTQVDFLDENPAIAMIGGCAGRIDRGGRLRRGARVPLLDHDDIRAQLLFRSAFQQSSIMGRANVLRAYPYSPSFPVCEDFDMFVRLTAEHRVANLPELLVDRRLHADQTIHRESLLIRQRTAAIARHLLADLEISPTDTELDRHVTLGSIKSSVASRQFLEWSEAWLGRVLDANRCVGIYDPESLAFVSGKVWTRACFAVARGADRSFALNRFIRSPLTRAAANGHGRTWFRAAIAMLVGIGTDRR